MELIQPIESLYNLTKTQVAFTTSPKHKWKAENKIKKVE
jgi:hypothetical protein